MAMKKNALLVQFDNARFGNIRGLLIDGDPCSSAETLQSRSVTQIRVRH